MEQTVVGLFDNFNDAQQTVTDLVKAGLNRDQISIVANDSSQEYAKYLTTDAGKDIAKTGDAVPAGKGASFGAVVGALTGVLVGLGALAIPGIGPVLAAGPLVAALGGGAVGAVAGAATGGIVGGLVKTGLPEEDAQHYAEGVRRGGTLVTATGSEDQANKAYDIMNRNGAINIDERVAQWRQSGWKNFDVNAKPYVAPAATTINADKATVNAQGKTVLPVVEEKLNVGKREVERGGVRVYSQVTERPVEENIQLREEHVNVERRPVDRAVNPEDGNAFREQTIEMTEKAEEAVVSKTARVVEEVVIGKDVTNRTETVRDTVRRTDVKVEQTGGQTVTGKAFETYDKDFRSDYTKNYAQSGYTYDQYLPAYRYGYNLANDPNYTGDWSSIESDAKSTWESRNKGTWDEFKGAIRRAYDNIRGAKASA